MMLNKLPPNIPITSVLSHLETSGKYGFRNRAIFACRFVLRIRDVSALQVSDVLAMDGTIRRFYISPDGRRFRLDDELRTELQRYLVWYFDLDDASLRQLTKMPNLNTPLFPTQKKERWTNNTLAQLYSSLDKQIHEYFKQHQPTKKPSMSQRLLSSCSR
jgi:hypothetical protein